MKGIEGRGRFEKHGNYEDTEQTDPTVNFEGVVASLRGTMRTIDDFLESRGDTLSPEEQAEISALEENMRKPFDPYASAF